MKIERIELTMSQLGLGRLNEYALMVLFGNAHSHQLTQGLAHGPDEIKDSAGLRLYPAYFKTLLRVPPACLLESYKLWQQVEVAVDVKRFGETLLQSEYVLGRPGEIPPDPNDWPKSALIGMTGNNLLVVDVREPGTVHRVSVPKRGLIVDLPKLKRPPTAIKRAREIRSEGFQALTPAPLTSSQPFNYHLKALRETEPGQAMIFAMFTRIMDYAEHDLLKTIVKPGLTDKLLDHLHTLERETYYYGNCFAGEMLDVFLSGQMRLTEANFHGPALNKLSAALFTFNMEITKNPSGALLAMARVEKLLALPTALQDHIQDIKRFYKRLS